MKHFSSVQISYENVVSQSFWGVLAAGVLFCSIAMNQLAGQSRGKNVDYHKIIDQRIDPVVFKTLTLGHLPTALDWKFIQVLTDTSTLHVSKGEHPSIYYGLDLVLELDPAYYAAYYGGSLLLSIVHDDGIGARDLLLKGNSFIKNSLSSYSKEFQEKHWPNTWNLAMLLAYVYLYDLDDMPHAAEFFQNTATLPHAPAYLLRLAERLSKPGGGFEVALKLINFQLEGAKERNDLQAQEKLEKRRLNLFIAKFLFDTEQQLKEFILRNFPHKTSEQKTSEQWEKIWAQFLRSSKISPVDSWGGRLSLDSSGKVVTTTPHEPVFGL